MTKAWLSSLRRKAPAKPRSAFLQPRLPCAAFRLPRGKAHPAAGVLSWAFFFPVEFSCFGFRFIRKQRSLKKGKHSQRNVRSISREKTCLDRRCQNSPASSLAQRSESHVSCFPLPKRTCSGLSSLDLSSGKEISAGL